jgi:hypothetical protein
MTKDSRVWKAEASKFWKQSSYDFRIRCEVLDTDTVKPREQVELEVDDKLIIIRQEEKRTAFILWLKEISKVAGEAAAWLEGVRVEGGK